MEPPISLTDLDQRIWDEELAEFVPPRILDVHTHLFRWDFNTDPNKEQTAYARFVGAAYQEATWDLLESCDRVLLPGRQVHRLSFGFPFPRCDFAKMNAFVADQVAGDPVSGALLLVHPDMPADAIERELERGGFLGLKPYRNYARSGDISGCRILDFLPEHQIEVVNARGLLVMLHLSRPDAIGDSANLDDLERLTEEYPRVRWILAHCARSYSAWPIERAAARLRALSGVWFDTSSVCESDAVEALLDAVGVERVMYGSDDVPVGVLRGKYIAFGHAWAYLSETNHRLDLSHCDGRMTFTRYESLRATRRAARRLGLSARQVQMLFADTAESLIASVRPKSRPEHAAVATRDGR